VSDYLRTYEAHTPKETVDKWTLTEIEHSPLCEMSVGGRGEEEEGLTVEERERRRRCAELNTGGDSLKGTGGGGGAGAPGATEALA